MSFGDAMKTRVRLAPLGITVFSALLAGAAHGQVRFVVSDLGPLPDFPDSQANAINNSGTIAGYSQNSTQITAVYWDGAATPTALESLSNASGTRATAISASDSIVGYSTLTSASQIVVATLWAAGEPAEGLGTLSGGLRSGALWINSVDEIVGYSDESGSNGKVHAIRWTREAGMRSLGTLAGDYESEALGINNGGAIVGYSRGAFTTAFLWSDTTGMVSLGTLGGITSQAYSINDAGVIVGYSTTSSGTGRGFLWTSAAGMVALPSAAQTFAYRINRVGLIVGLADYGFGDLRAVLWTPGGATTHELNDLQQSGSPFIRLMTAYSVNDRGWIVGYGELASSPGDYHAFLAQPTATCPGDLNLDFMIDLSDLATLLSHFGSTGTYTEGDLDHDGKIDLADLAQLLSLYGLTC